MWGNTVPLLTKMSIYYLLDVYRAFPGAPLSSASRECSLLRLAVLGCDSCLISGRYSWQELTKGKSGNSAKSIDASAQQSSATALRNRVDRLALMKFRGAVPLHKIYNMAYSCDNEALYTGSEVLLILEELAVFAMQFNYLSYLESCKMYCIVKSSFRWRVWPYLHHSILF